MSQIDSKTKFFLVLAVSTTLTACAPQAPVDNGKSSNSSNGSSNLLPSNGAPVGGTPGALPAPTPTPAPGTTPPSTASCAAAANVTWMLQDTSYRVDFAGSPEKRSYLCSGSLPSAAVGSSAMASSTNGNSGILMYSCQMVNGVPTWQSSATYNTTTGAPVNVSCGIYNSTYRPANVSKIDYRFHESRIAGAQNQMYGMSMIVRSSHPSRPDHLFSFDKNEGPSAGYVLEGVGFNTVHLALTQDLGRSANSVTPPGLTKVYRCVSPSRNQHYVTTSPNCDASGDIFEASGGYLFASSNAQVSGAALVPVYRCLSAMHDFATPSLAECQSVNGTVLVLGFSLQ